MAQANGFVLVAVTYKFVVPAELAADEDALVDHVSEGVMGSLEESTRHFAERLEKTEFETEAAAWEAV